MYQGKFSSNNANQGNINDELLAARNSGAGVKPAVSAEPDIIRPKKRTAPAPEQPMEETVQAPKKAKKTKPVQTDFRQAIQMESFDEQEAEPRKKGASLGTVIFYTLYFLFIAIFVGATFLGLNWLNGWLVSFEAAQPTVKSEQVFQSLFANPNWGTIYDLSDMESTRYESKDVFVAYMSEKVSNPAELSFAETSAGMSGGKKYNVRLGDERIGYFTLADANHVTNNTDIPDWKLDEVKIEVSRNETYRISKVENHTAFVNGVALDEDYTIQIASTKADEYLPAGITSARTAVMEIGGLLMKPEVVIKNPSGNEMTVTYDEASRTFTEATDSNTITKDLEELAFATAETYGKYTFGAVSSAAVGKYFVTDSDTYKTIMKLEQWNKSKWASYKVTSQEILAYERYADNVFSARVKMVITLTLKTNATMDWEVDSTFFFNKRNNGSWICYNMTNEDVQSPVGQVRLTFMDGTTKLDSRFVQTDAKELQLPVVSVPLGKSFGGWVKETVNAGGTKELTVIFTPDAEGKVTLAAGTVLEPMTLYTYFE